jgi:hypothetical protein
VSRKITDEKINQYAKDYYSKIKGATAQYIESEVYLLLKRTDIPAGEYDIEGIEFDEGTQLNRMVITAKVQESAAPKSETEKVEGEMVSENKAKKGIEIKFPSIPSEAIRNELKQNGFRWSKFHKVWYHKATADTLEAAHKIEEMWKAEKKAV